MKISAILLILLAASSAGAANRWKTQFFHDRDDSSLEIRDFQCPSASTCIAVGFLLGRKEKPKGTSVISRNGGDSWEYSEIKELPYSLFFLNGSLGWMVTDKGIWRTEEGAREWKKTAALKGVERLWFLDANHGFAVGEKKSVWESTDGGKIWNELALTDNLGINASDVVYESIVFADAKRGWIAGSWNPMRQAQAMEWAELGNARRKDLPMSSVLGQTADAGHAWKFVEARIHGDITRVRAWKGNEILLLTELISQSTAPPSQIFQFDTTTLRGRPVFQQTGRVARDFVVLPSGEVVIAAIELSGNSNEVPVPGKLRMMESSDPTSPPGPWMDEKADYRAVARRPILAFADATHVFVATENGMILKRVPDTTPAR